MLTYVAFSHSFCSDPVKCDLGSDGIVGIFAAIFYLGLGITMIVCPVPNSAVLTCIGEGCCKDGGCDCCGEEAAQVAVETPQVAKQKVLSYNPDGTVTVSKETINPDGSKTVMVTTRPNEDATGSGAALVEVAV